MDPCWSSGGGFHHTGVVAHLAQKSSHTNAQELGVQSKTQQKAVSRFATPIRYLCPYAMEWGKAIAPAGSFDP